MGSRSSDLGSASHTEDPSAGSRAPAGGKVPLPQQQDWPAATVIQAHPAEKRGGQTTRQ